MNLSKILSRFAQSMRQTAGFTMIELLVVISIIGVLAVAVLSSINPIEQINKGRDTRTRSDAAQLVNAIDRYVAIHEAFPWNRPLTPGGALTAGAPTNPQNPYSMSDASWGDATIDGWADHLFTTDEVKQSFIDRQRDTNSGNRLYIIKPDGYSAGAYVCFIPASNAFKQEALDDCQTGANTAVLNSEVSDNLCPSDENINANNYICIP